MTWFCPIVHRRRPLLIPLRRRRPPRRPLEPFNGDAHLFGSLALTKIIVVYEANKYSCPLALSTLVELSHSLFFSPTHDNNHNNNFNDNNNNNSARQAK